MLLGAEDPIAGVAQTGDDIAVVVELLIQSGAVDIHVGVIMMHPLNALGSGDNVHQLDVLDLIVLDELDGGRGGAARWPAWDPG